MLLGSGTGTSTYVHSVVASHKSRRSGRVARAENHKMSHTSEDAGDLICAGRHCAGKSCEDEILSVADDTSSGAAARPLGAARHTI